MFRQYPRGNVYHGSDQTNKSTFNLDFTREKKSDDHKQWYQFGSYKRGENRYRASLSTQSSFSTWQQCTKIWFWKHSKPQNRQCHYRILTQIWTALSWAACVGMLLSFFWTLLSKPGQHFLLVWHCGARERYPVAVNVLYLTFKELQPN